MRTLLGSFFLVLFVAGGGVTALAAPISFQAADVAARSPHSTRGLPATLHQMFYKALSKDVGNAHPVGRDGCAVLSKQALKACFDAHGVRFSDKGATPPLALHLTAFGRSAHLVSLTPVQPKVAANRVSYAHGTLTEWWRVLPMGFEQGFTLTRRPGGHGKLTLALTASDRASQHQGTLAWGRFRYGDLVVVDANGKALPATLKSENNRILISVNDAHATYPLTVDPLVWLEQRVTATDGAENDQFGYSVALDGNTAVIGALDATVGDNTFQGAAYVFTKSGGVWTQAQKLVASDGAAYDYFGTSVALSGTTILVGSPHAAVEGNPFQGAVYVFTKSGGTWTQAQKLTAGDGASYGTFGQAIAFHGTTAFVAAGNTIHNDDVIPDSVYIFTRAGDTWNQTQKILSPNAPLADEFGYAVAFSGATALIGAAFANVNDQQAQGAVYVYTNSDGTWTQTQRLTASDGAAGDYFGVAVDFEDATALIGAELASGPVDADQGAVYEFTDANGSWMQTAKLTANDAESHDDFGSFVALEGTTALIGALGYNSLAGKAYVFTESGGTWAQAREIFPSDAPTFGIFGFAGALSGTTALIGAHGADVNGNNFQGAAYFYGRSDLEFDMSAPQTVGQGQQYVSQAIATNNASAASPAVSATITVPAAASFVSATASQGSCSETSGVVTCDFGAIDGNAGAATANVTLKATGNVGDTIENVASVAKATPPLSASAPTTITEGGACPEGYTEYDGNLNPGEVARSPVYQAPGGSENAILTAPEGFELYAVYQSGRFGRHVYRMPGNEVHRWGPKGLYMWLVRAHDGASSYTLCLQHP